MVSNCKEHSHCAEESIKSNIFETSPVQCKYESLQSVNYKSVDMRLNDDIMEPGISGHGCAVVSVPSHGLLWTLLPASALLSIRRYTMRAERDGPGGGGAGTRTTDDPARRAQCAM